MNNSEFFSKTDFSFTDTFTDIRKIYSSAMGSTEVYAARKALKRFALKSLKPEFRDDPIYVGLLRKEFEIGFRLEHPNIVHTYSFEKVEGLGPCIVLEWIEGETLAWHLSNLTLDDKTWLKVVMEICDALEYLKTRQIVHRDIKPSNVMLTYDGNQVKLVDFGFADSPEYGSLKHSGGTRAYAAPEQLSNLGIKSTSDIYALGKVMEILPIRKNKKIRSLIRRMCSEQPSERPQSTGEIKEKLEKASARRHGNIYILFFAIVVIAFVAVLFMYQRKDAPPINVKTENTEEIKEQSIDTVQPETPTAADTIVTIEKYKNFVTKSHTPTKIENPVSEEKDTSEIKTPKRVVHWMVILTAQQTRGTAKRLREKGDTLWAEHTRMEIGEWVDSQTDCIPELRTDCHDEINRILVKLKNEGN